MEMKDKIVVRGELALVLAVLINSFAVAVTVYAGWAFRRCPASRMRCRWCSRF